MLRRPPDQFLTPADLELVERVLKIAQRQGDTPAELEDRAMIAVWLFQGGVREEETLASMLK